MLIDRTKPSYRYLETKVITPPSNYVLSLEDAKLYLRLSSTAEDSLITSLIKAAENKLEIYSNLSFSYKEIYCNYRDVVYNSLIELPFGKHRELVRVETYEDGVGVEMDATGYELDNSGDFWRIRFKRNSNENEVFRIVLLVGYADEAFSGGGSANVPDEILTAIKVTVAYWYEQRGISSDADIQKPDLSIPILAKNLLQGLSKKNWF